MSTVPNESNEQATFKCTSKCMEALENNHVITGRARQFCLLLLNKDAISTKLSNKLENKVNTAKLIDAGYIKPVNETRNKIKQVKPTSAFALTVKNKTKNKPLTNLIISSDKRDADKKTKLKLITSSTELKSSVNQHILKQRIVSPTAIKDNLDNDSLRHNVPPRLQMATGDF